MSVTPSEFVEVAKTLCGGPGEGAFRTSLGRCYYGSYHACLLWHASLPEPGMIGGSGAAGVHEQLILQLLHPGKSVEPAQKAISRLLGPNLRIMKTRRHVADYQLESAIDPSEVVSQLAMAERVLSRTAPAT